MSRDLFQRGDRLGDYEILGRLRAGGMATLFLGRRHGAAGVSRQVVIKVIHPHLADDELIVKMFIDEARISSHIAHGNVVYVENFGEHEGIYYMVMEYVDSCSVDQVLRASWQRRERLPPELATHIALETAAGLHAAHETRGEDGTPLGIVHRDVSPSNILITLSGRIKVIDFGIAKARGRLGATKSGHSLKGKLRYMSPEQAWGHEIDRRTDVYALGIVLWELLTCKQLFREDDDFKLLEKVRNPKIPPPSSINPDVSVALDAVVLRATAKEPADRIATANELRRELMRAVPDALTVPSEALGTLVGQTRDTLGIQPIEIELEATTPSNPIDQDIVQTVSTGELSASGGVGELRAQHPRRRGAALVGLAVVGAAAVAIVVVVAFRGGSDEATAVVPNTRPSFLPHPPVESTDAALATETAASADAALAALTPDAPAADAPAVTVRKRPRPKRPIKTKPDIRGVEVDGVLLADPDSTGTPKPRPRPKTKPDVKVDGTPLSP